MSRPSSDGAAACVIKYAGERTTPRTVLHPARHGSTQRGANCMGRRARLDTSQGDAPHQSDAAAPSTRGSPATTVSARRVALHSSTADCAALQREHDDGGSSQHRLGAPAAAAQSSSPQPPSVRTGRVEQRVRPPPRARRAGRSPAARRTRAVGMCGARPARASIEVGEQRRVSRLHRAWA